MTSEEARLVLGALQPGPLDPADPQVAAALARLEEDPELAAWFERERAWDRAYLTKLETVAPPPELRSRLLATATSRASSGAPGRVILAAAAAVVLLGALALVWDRTARREAVVFAALIEAAVADHVGDHSGAVFAEGEHPATAVLTGNRPLLTAAREVPVLAQQGGCRSFLVRGHEVLEICFVREGVEFHFYAAARSGFLQGRDEVAPQFSSLGRATAVAWSDADFVYAVVTDAGQPQLERLLRGERITGAE